ncbi:ISAs1 family transposase [Streptomyces sp. NBC_01717]|uniref:ISAs1 family transposase n=1 Tax=Streptomyces sp. NBC_01717 TaxID=2975918 RepID=UPI002E30C276|nr:ISAs1 family transposase [Streptomyces sp. NBC_01717]
MPVLDRSSNRAHGREEIREAKVVTVDGLHFPHVRQVVRTRRKRRRIGTKKWAAETVYSVTDLEAEQATAAEIAAWARGHWIIENTVHWTKDVTFAEDTSQIRRHHTPAFMTTLRDLVRSILRLAYGQHRQRTTRPHPPRNSPHHPRHPVIKTGDGDSPRGPGGLAVGSVQRACEDAGDVMCVG